MPRVEWEPENETYAEFKKRRSANSGISGMGQKKREGTGKINKSELREKALQRAKYQCEWHNCSERTWLEMAHIKSIGMGGKNRDISNEMWNVAILCKRHHDIFDGRQQAGAHKEYQNLLRGYLKRDAEI
jgi:predicted restriction endonuclease